MKTLKNRLTSRKFLFAIGGVAASLILALIGELEWSEAMPYITSYVLGYLGIEGGNDIVRTWKK